MAWTEWPRSGYALDHGIDVDPTVKRLANDPTVKPDYFVVVGLLGRAAAQNTWRIYLNWALSEWYEVQEEAIIYVRATLDDRSRIWLRHGANVRLVGLDPQRAEEAQFIDGPITRRADWTPEGGREGGWGGEPTTCSCGTKSRKCN